MKTILNSINEHSEICSFASNITDLYENGGNVFIYEDQDEKDEELFYNKFDSTKDDVDYVNKN